MVDDVERSRCLLTMSGDPKWADRCEDRGVQFAAGFDDAR